MNADSHFEQILGELSALQFKYSFFEDAQKISLNELVEDISLFVKSSEDFQNSSFNKFFEELSSSFRNTLRNYLDLGEVYESSKSSHAFSKKMKDYDQKYFEHLKKEDYQSLEEIVELVAKENGFNHTVYRGDDKPYLDYTELFKKNWEEKSCGGALGRGLYFASTERYADVFGTKARYRGVTRKFFLRANPVDIQRPDVVEFIKEFQAPYMEEVNRLDTEADKHRKGRKVGDPPNPAIEAYARYVDKLQNKVFAAIKEKFRADAVYVENYGLFAREGEWEYNIQNVNHAKLADIIVKDNGGNVIAPSKRFDPTCSDIRGVHKDYLFEKPVVLGIQALGKDVYRDGDSFVMFGKRLFEKILQDFGDPRVVKDLPKAFGLYSPRGDIRLQPSVEDMGVTI